MVFHAIFKEEKYCSNLYFLLINPKKISIISCLQKNNLNIFDQQLKFLPLQLKFIEDYGF